MKLFQDLILFCALQKSGKLFAVGFIDILKHTMT